MKYWPIQFQTLSPLPGGSKNYLQVIDRFLILVSAQGEMPRAAAYEWFRGEYGIAQGTFNGCVQLMSRLELIELDSEAVLGITAFGKAVLEAGEAGKAELLIEKLMDKCLAMAEVLHVYYQASQAIHLNQVVSALAHKYPHWLTENQFEDRCMYLHACLCLTQVRARNYAITPFGRQIAERHPVSTEADMLHPDDQVGPDEGGPDRRPEPPLIDTLLRDATDSANYKKLELSVGRAFSSVGYGVTLLGESGDTDLLVEARLGLQSYSLIVDTKARRDGKLTELNPLSLKAHRQEHNADYAVVVAQSFAQGDLVGQAEDNGILLMPIKVLADWIRLHAASPLSLLDYRAILTTSGLLPTLPSAVTAIVDRQARWRRLLFSVVRFLGKMQAETGSGPLPEHELHWMLYGYLRDTRFTADEVSSCLRWLAHPVLGAVHVDEAGSVALTMDLSTLAQAIARLSQQACNGAEPPEPGTHTDSSQDLPDER